MLPFPVAFSSRTDSRTRHYRSTRDVLLTRARITNLGFLLLAGFAALSFLLNLWHYFTDLTTYEPQEGRGPYSAPRGIWETLQRDKSLEEIDHLVMVPGHAIWKGMSVEERLDEDQWVLEPYQRGGGRISAFFAQIVGGAELAREDEHSLLVFSGGQTRPSSTTTEAESYMRLASVSDILPSSHSSSTLRATTENYALDSYQNLLFSIARFHEYTGRWPSKITVVGYEFKRRRFTELHRAALRWPADRFDYIGIDADGDTELARQGELQNGYLPYTQDTYGCHDTLLSKRRARNPSMRFHPYYSSAPALGPLLNWCPGRAEGGQTAVYPGPLPWDHGTAFGRDS
ncbi:hypothetical protein BD309DRAFT_931037 [Dichomitus squalens]|uniref:DUF218 domain-containing protein n=1 Tax=Dichomitus squalens (strain LYAD-421) TaxID=732165 RepID=R7SW79_DICSQ|nr:uncharacterized protein DICSQDRAFT_107557 [Dichomitus squalens LYAD-421 SS1]EJF60459.1 hypothetical protein DICSQDRAFT_107557 [Dichomitus squalens LYAD-421 SS1]TBU38240.1 hypothetical protein BD309DRAFT_931037 [Dichomitus squalens]